MALSVDDCVGELMSALYRQTKYGNEGAIREADIVIKMLQDFKKDLMKDNFDKESENVG